MVAPKALRARIYDLSGTCLGQKAVPYETKFSPGARPGRTRDWWNALIAATAGAIADAGIDAAEIEGDVLCHHLLHGGGAGRTWPRAASGAVVDGRAPMPGADAVLATGDAALAINGARQGPVSAEWMIPGAVWLKRNPRPSAARTICEYQDFLTLRPDQGNAAPAPR